MKFKIFKMLIIFGMILAVPLIYMGRFDPMAFMESGFSGGMSEFDDLKAKAPKNITNVVTDEKVKVYKWRDKNGLMQFSNSPPPAGEVEQIELNPNENIVQAVKVPVEEVEQKQTAAVERPNVYSPKGMKKVMDDVKNVEKLMQQRSEDQQKMLGDM